MTPRPPTHRKPPPPPEGYRKATDKDIQCLPKGALFYHENSNTWATSESEYAGRSVCHGLYYAVPITQENPQKTLRDEFAMAALTGMWANHKCVEKGTDWMIAHALISADAMLAARNQSIPLPSSE